MRNPFAKKLPRGIVIKPKKEVETYQYYKKDVGMQTNKYRIIIQDKGLFDFLTVEKPLTESTFKFKYKDNTYQVNQDTVFPIDTNIFARFWKWLRRSKLNYEYYTFFQKGQEKALVTKPKDKITGSLLYTVMHSQTTKEMLSSLLKGEGLSFGFLSWRVLVMIGATIGIGIFMVNEMGWIHLFPPISGMI